jgi:hypothetical protein
MALDFVLSFAEQLLLGCGRTAAEASTKACLPNGYDDARTEYAEELVGRPLFRAPRPPARADLAMWAAVELRNAEAREAEARALEASAHARRAEALAREAEVRCLLAARRWGA